MKAWCDQSVGQIAVQVGRAASLFEELRIDYCCGGNRTLREACALAGVSAEQVAEEIEAFQREPEEAVDWRKEPVERIIAHILQRHHEGTRRGMGRLRNLMAKVVGTHGVNHPELGEVQNLFLGMAGELEGHMAKEEELIFPSLLEMERNPASQARETALSQGGPLVDHPIQTLMREHAMTGKEWEELRRLTREFTPPPDACPSYKALLRGLQDLELDLHRHVHLENNVLFQRFLEKGWLD